MSTIDLHTLDLATVAWLAGSAANEHLLRRLRAAGHPDIRNAHGYVFQHLLGGTRTVGELAERLGVSQQAASKVVRELEQLGYVERKDDAADKRIRHVRLTRKGHTVIARGRSNRAALDAKLEGTIGASSIDDARTALIALLEIVGGRDAVTARRVKAPSP